MVRPLHDRRRKVYLFKQTINGHDVIVGRIDADHDLAEDSQPGHFDHFDLHDSDDAAVFAITIDPATGKVYLVAVFVARTLLFAGCRWRHQRTGHARQGTLSASRHGD